jgi:MinD superfamily P-loop ATPase
MAVEMTREIGVDRGVIINRDGTGNTDVEEYCERENIPVLMKIPLDMDIARYYSLGIPLIEGMPQWEEPFRGLFMRIEEMVGEGNRSLKR